jgi:hypothetical protein
MGAIPQGATILAAPEQLDFLHCRTVRLATSMTALQAWDAAMANPLPGMATAFRIRDAISARFGVKRIGGFGPARRDRDPRPGEKLAFFLVEAISDQELVLTERDRHLDVMTTVHCKDCELSIISSVRTHNLFGRIYMIPVGPAHRLIVWAMMRRMGAS